MIQTDTQFHDSVDIAALTRAARKDERHKVLGEVGAWSVALQPHIQRFRTASVFDMEVVITPQGAGALAAALTNLSGMVDRAAAIVAQDEL
jgi:hypothetical protein